MSLRSLADFSLFFSVWRLPECMQYDWARMYGYDIAVAVFDAYFVDSNAQCFFLRRLLLVLFLCWPKWKCYRHRLLCTIFPWSIFNDSWRDWILWRIYDGMLFFLARSVRACVCVFCYCCLILLVVPRHRIPTSITNLWVKWIKLILLRLLLLMSTFFFSSLLEQQKYEDGDFEWEREKNNANILWTKSGEWSVPMLLLLLARPNKIVACFERTLKFDKSKFLLVSIDESNSIQQTYVSIRTHTHSANEMRKKSARSSSLSLTHRFREIDEMLYHDTRTLNSRSAVKSMSVVQFSWKNIWPRWWGGSLEVVKMWHMGKLLCNKEEKVGDSEIADGVRKGTKKSLRCWWRWNRKQQ